MRILSTLCLAGILMIAAQGAHAKSPRYVQEIPSTSVAEECRLFGTVAKLAGELRDLGALPTKVLAPLAKNVPKDTVTRTIVLHAYLNPHDTPLQLQMGWEASCLASQPQRR